jgi:hypothetical protein
LVPFDLTARMAFLMSRRDTDAPLATGLITTPPVAALRPSTFEGSRRAWDAARADLAAMGFLMLFEGWGARISSNAQVKWFC